MLCLCYNIPMTKQDNHEFKGSGRLAPEFLDSDLSHPNLPDSVRNIVDPQISKDLDKFREQFPDVSEEKLLEVRDSRMLARVFAVIKELPNEDQIEVMSTLTSYSLDLTNQSKQIVEGSNGDEDIYKHTKLLHSAMYYQNLQSHLAVYADSQKDADLKNYGLDMQLFAYQFANPKFILEGLSKANYLDYFRIIDGFESMTLTNEDKVTVEDLIYASDKEIHYMYKPMNYYHLIGSEVNLDKTNSAFLDKSVFKHVKGNDHFINFIDKLSNEDRINYKNIDSVFMNTQFSEYLHLSGQDQVLTFLFTDINRLLGKENANKVLFKIIEGANQSWQYAISLLFNANNSANGEQSTDSFVEDSKIFRGIFQSISKRLIEQVAAVHALVDGRKAIAHLFTGHQNTGELDSSGNKIFKPIVEEYEITSIEQVSAGMDLISKALESAQRILDNPRRVVISSDDNFPVRAAFKEDIQEDNTLSSADKTETRIKTKSEKEADKPGDPRIDLTHRISINEARELAPILKELFGDRFDEESFLKSKGRAMRTFSLRLDLEDFGSPGLSFDIGSTTQIDKETNKLKEPLGFLLACVVSAGAAELSRIKKEELEYKPNNHVRSEFDQEAVDPKKFGSLLIRLVSYLADKEKSE